MVAGVNMVNAQSSTKDFVSEACSLDKIFPFHFRNKPFTLSYDRPSASLQFT